MSIKKSTPVLLVPEIEPCVKFWERLGFSKTVEVPEGDKLAFVILVNGAIELMYQTYSSVQADNATIGAEAGKGPAFLYVEVDNLADTRQAIADVPLLMQERTTFYGAKEFAVKDPGGHIVTFAQMGAQ